MIVAETGELFAAADTDGNEHLAYRVLLSGHSDPLVVPLPVVVEASHMIGSRLGPTAEARLISASGRDELELDHLAISDSFRALL